MNIKQVSKALATMTPADKAALLALLGDKPANGKAEHLMRGAWHNEVPSKIRDAFVQAFAELEAHARNVTGAPKHAKVAISVKGKGAAIGFMVE